MSARGILVALCFIGCRSSSTPAAPDAGTAPSAAALSPPAPARDAGPCDEVWREAQVDVAFKEEPEASAAQRTGPRLERRFKVARQLQGAYRHGDQWASVLEYEAGAVRGGVSYSLAVPAVLADLSGRTVTWTTHREPVGCASDEGEQPMLLAGDTLRDEQGGLLLLTVPSAPTTPEGEVLLPPGLVPELRVHWEDAGCAVEPASRSKSVRLRFADAGARGTSAAPVSVSVGETRHLLLGGVRHEVRVARARAESSGRCGQAVFTVSRAGLREQRRSK
ncbi:hypothetical protein [Pyxidicoccus xibeiensis]|uniref:hypothetical protein n=1 Tax=Pyxidicoccus xibeiensis TaxID=2906759 RepID=UPI0020A7C546|nr:hypothetical protein [Pyxidicoccus xibeiensis]MCP3139587.1 hypothetical protein [Pyxidicoccus xibeiensis]